MIIKLKKIIKKPLFIGAVVVVLLLSWYFYANRDTGPTYQTAKAVRDDVMEEVSVTGRVKSAEDIAVSFEKSGRVSSVRVVVGEKVTAGKLLATLDAVEAQTQLNQAEADLNVQQARIDSASIALNEAKNGLVDKIQDAYTKADDTLRSKADEVFSEASSNPKLLFTMDKSNNQLKADIEQLRRDTEVSISSWKLTLNALNSSSDLQSYIDKSKDGLSSMKALLDKIATGLNAYTLTTFPTQNTVNAWKTDISAARNTVSLATSNLLAAEEKWKTSASNLTLQKTQLESNSATIQNLQAQFNKSAIYSPINGIVTKVDIKPGETVNTTTPVINLISENDFEVEANIPEADIAKVSLGSETKVTLDAYGDEVVFKAHVASIDPAETIIEGVTTYKIKVEFAEADSRIKSGMTANMDIQGKSENDVIVIPQQAVATKNGEKVVRVLRNGLPVEIKVKAGLRGANGNIAIIEGLNEGDEVILSQE